MTNRSRRRWLASALALVLGLALGLLPAVPSHAQARRNVALHAPGASSDVAFPLSQQPFYPELEAIRTDWQKHQLGQVVTDSPRGTVLNFYALMAEVEARAAAISRAGALEPGWGWSSQQIQNIENTKALFELAVGALDASRFPGSVRADMAQEAALQLKQILDYVFSYSSGPISLPNSAEFRLLSNTRGTPVSSWRLPGTAITLSTDIDNDPENSDFFFSADTVSRIGKMYEDIHLAKLASNQFTTGDLYQRYSDQPGQLIAPKWYLKLPQDIRSILDISYFNQTILQISSSLIALLIGIVIVSFLILWLLKTYRFRDGITSTGLPTTEDDNIAWLRVILVLPILPLARLSKIFVDDYINVTGKPLEIVTYFYYIVYFLASSLLCFLLFEAIGRSGAEWLMKLRGSSSPLTLQRTNNLLMPICRSLGVLSALFLLYQLLILLGLPPATVLAFSAVPGLAIGLGASKLLGNLFAGLAIQTDRPLRVGEFCKVGEDTGFITKIGLRSVELQTLESRITIPNSVADEATIVNYSRRNQASEASPMQGLDLRLSINEELSPEQINDLLYYTRTTLHDDPDLQDVMVSIDQDASNALTLICFAMVSLHGWIAFLRVRERVLRRLQERIDQVKKSRIVIGVSYDTSQRQLREIPELIKTVINRDADFSFRSCRLMKISEFSYDYVLDFRSTHNSYRAFKDGINRLNQDLLACFEAQGIEIPFPTQTEYQRG